MVYPIRKVGVVGGGTMGSGIAAVIARYRPVIVKEENQALAEKAKETICRSFQRAFDSGHIKDQNELDQRKSYVICTADLGDLAEVDLVIEAIPENMELKQKLFAELDRIMPAHVILASNTSSLPITEIAEATNRPDKVVGTHFFNPPTQMPLVELVRGRKTSDDTISIVERLCRTLEKKTIRVIDRPGFAINSILMPYIGEGVMALEQNDVSAKDIDAEARKFGLPMGPFTMLDLVGLDTAYFVAEFMARSYPDKIQMGTLFKAMVDAGRLGKKVGIGFYDFDVNGSHESLETFLQRILGPRPVISAEEVFQRMLALKLNASVQIFQDQVTSKGEIETGTQFGLGFPGGGPLHVIDKMGADKLVEQLLGFSKILGPRFLPSQLLLEMAEKGEKFFKVSKISL